MYLGMNMLVQEKQSKVDMKLIKFIICFVLILSINNNAKALTGVGPVSFSKSSFEWFLAYLRGDGETSGEIGFRQGTPGTFAINPEGTWAYYAYCPLKYGSGGCRFDYGQIVQGCSKGSKSVGGSRCKLFAKGYKVVWGGANIKFSRKYDEQVVRAIFQQNGWYGDTTSEKKPKITKKKEIKPKISKKNNTVEQLKEIKKMLDEGLITETEFKKLKEEILN